MPLDGVGAGLVTLALGLLHLGAHQGIGSGCGTCGSLVGGARRQRSARRFFMATSAKLGSRAIMPFDLFSSSTFVGTDAADVLFVWQPRRTAGTTALLSDQNSGLGRHRRGRRVAARAGSHRPRLAVHGQGGVSPGRAPAIGHRVPAWCAPGWRCTPGVPADHAGYWLDIFPPTLLVALGMGACVAPLTTAVLSSVDAGHFGLASGFNSAVARIAGLVATALLGFVFARQESAAGFMIAPSRRAPGSARPPPHSRAAAPLYLIRPADPGAQA